MILTMPDFDTKCFLNSQKEKKNTPGDLEAGHIEPENIKDHLIENQEDVHQSSCNGYCDECLLIDFSRCLTFGHCGKDRNGQKRVKDDKQGSKCIDNF